MKQITSQFKYTIDLGVKATKTTFKLKKTRKDAIMHILLVAFMLIFVGVLVWDIIRDASIVLDLIILIALIGMEIFSLLMPVLIVHIQKKFLKKLNLAEIEYTTTEINKGKCLESYYKDNKIVMQNVCDMDKLIAYEVDSNYIFAVFNNFVCAVFDIDTLSISIDEMIAFLDNIISKNKSNKFKK